MTREGEHQRGWTEEEDAFLKGEASSLSAAEVAEKLGRSIPAVRLHCRQVGVRLRDARWRADWDAEEWVCSSCGKSKPRTEFYAARRGKQSKRCKDCRRA